VLKALLYLWPFILEREEKKMNKDVIIIGRREFDTALNSGMVIEDLLRLKQLLIRGAYNNFRNKCQRTCRTEQARIRKMSKKQFQSIK